MAKSRDDLLEKSRQEEVEREKRSREEKALRLSLCEELKASQPLACSILDRALENHEVSHAWLFHGPKGSLKKEAAWLLAESLILETNGIVKEEELNAEQAAFVERMRSGASSSLIFVDGNRREKIKKEEVDRIQERFSRSASEKSGARVYILNHMDNSTLEAQNSLLKFLEEPGEGVYAILTVDNPHSVLSTIQSRCVLLPFRALSYEEREQQGLRVGLDPEDAHLLRSFGYGEEEVLDLVSGSAYQNAKSMFKQALGPDSAFLLVDYESRYKAKSSEGPSGKDSNILIWQLFLGFLIEYYRSILSGAGDGPAWYHEAVENARLSEDAFCKYSRKLKIASEQRDLVNRYNDLSLLGAQTLWRLEVFK